ncbi:response regulator transcription factor [Brucella anthropi]|uniref:response regulator transcription factor n=1 Tax=Brucella anthropi TaxID=529 RepID=UPI00384D9860
MNSEHYNDSVVYIVDDDRSVRLALSDLFASVGLKVFGFASVREFLEHRPEQAPACLILDVRMPEESGIEFHARMKALGIRLPVIFITGHGDIAMGVKAIKDGAIDFLPKPFRDQDLLDTVHQAINADRQRLIDDHNCRSLERRYERLNPGERAVFELVVKGLMNKQIASELGVAEVTVKVRRSHLMHKMRARSITDLVRMAVRLDARLSQAGLEG